MASRRHSGIAYSFCCPLADAPLYIRTLLQPKTLSTQRNLLILKYQLAAVNGRQRASSCLFTLLHWGKVAMSQLLSYCRVVHRGAQTEPMITLRKN
jgi:hypothetical protein